MLTTERKNRKNEFRLVYRQMTEINIFLHVQYTELVTLINGIRKFFD